MDKSWRYIVKEPPPRPLLLWDGDCHFCRRWVERLREVTGGAVDDAPYQERGKDFPEIAPEQFQESVVLIEPDGKVFVGAEAIYRALGVSHPRSWLHWSYRHVPGFVGVSEFFYRMIARNRGIASKVMRLLWGRDVRRPTYFVTRRWFARAMGLVYLVAFVSLWVQVDGLIGSNGILPVSQFLPAMREHFGTRALWALPTLCWWNSSDVFLHFLCAAGVAFSLLLIFTELVPALLALVLFVFYLSLTLAGQTFLSFQWDILLLEAGFLLIFFVPWRLRGGATPAPVSRAALFLLKLLLFKLMLMSGVVKLTSGDDSWGWSHGWWHWDLATALDYHYWTQPLPTLFAWWAEQMPEWSKHFSVAACLVIEIFVPFLIFGPRRLRSIAFLLLVFLQIAIAITGNYCFFNLLTIVLCLPLLDDVVWRRSPGQAPRAPEAVPIGISLQRLCAILLLVVTLPLNAWLIYTAFRPEAEWPEMLGQLYGRLEVFRVVNGYGLFRVMTKERREIVVQGSADGADWKAYEFKWKPGQVNRAPGWCAPHQPRLDWQMWFAALGSARQNEWFLSLALCLLQGKAEVRHLLASDPFPEAPPRYVRALFYRYRFTTPAERQETGDWWKREELGEYLQPVSLR